MQRWVAAVAYHGAAYSGWQRQPDAVTVQGCVEQALSAVADHAITVTCAGRTDSGVHAQGQIIHFDSEAKRDSRQWLLGVNTHLPSTIGLLWVIPIMADFDARFSATARHYIYVINNSQVPNPLMREHALWEGRSLDCDVLAQVGVSWLGEQDFSSFRDSQCQAQHPRRRLLDWSVSTRGDFIFLHVVANAFLHHMVRNMVGVALRIAMHKKPVVWAKEVLLARDRSCADVTVSACGLYLHRVYYPELYQRDFPQLGASLWW